MKRNAFTLLEVLVVIAIIALLATLLMPTFKDIRMQSRRLLCANNLKEIRVALQLASSKPDLSGRITNNPYPDPAEWPAVPYKTVPMMSIYVCPEDTELKWPASLDGVPGMTYKSAMCTYEEFPIAHGTFCKARRGEDADGAYTEFVVEENTGHYSAHGYACFGAEFWENRPWYPSGPDWSNNDGLFRFYDEKDGVRKFKLQYCTCGMDNKLYYFGELIWHPLKSHVGTSMDLCINTVYSSYGINSAVRPSGIAPHTILILDYPDRMACYTDSIIDKTKIADQLDEVSQRHGGKVNVLLGDGSVRTVGASELKPTIDPAPWSP